MRTAPKKSTPPVTSFKVGDRVKCVRGFEKSSVLTGSRWIVHAVGKTTIEIRSDHMAYSSAPGRWPAVRFELLPTHVVEDTVEVAAITCTPACEMCGGYHGNHHIWCMDALV